MNYNIDQRDYLLKGINMIFVQYWGWKHLRWILGRNNTMCPNLKMNSIRIYFPPNFEYFTYHLRTINSINTTIIDYPAQQQQCVDININLCLAPEMIYFTSGTEYFTYNLRTVQSTNTTMSDLPAFQQQRVYINTDFYIYPEMTYFTLGTE